MAVHKCLDTFELRVLAQQAPTKELSSIRTELASPQTDVDVIFYMHVA